MGAVGAQGERGEPGGDDRIFGDGAAGALTVSASGQLFFGAVANTNLQFTDVTIDAGVTLVVPSGVTLRCTGTFTNHGTIQVQPAAAGAVVLADVLVFEAGSAPAIRPAHPGVALSAASGGQIGDASQRRIGGFGGEPLGFTTLVAVHPGLVGGGGGGATAPRTRGGAGGGSITVLAAGAILNAGTISADGAAGQAGAGGGGGGVILLASRVEVTNDGTLAVKGGTGGAPSPVVAGGGGGSGGIVHLLAPTISGAGTVVRIGGEGGPATTLTAAIRGAGAGGGGCGGPGGQGGLVSTDGVATAGNVGSLGYTLRSEVDPTALF